MKILHVCLAAFYIDNYSYQENLLPKYHKKMGHTVEILASLVTFNEQGKPDMLENPTTYLNEDGIKVTRIKYKSSNWEKLRRYIGIENAIQDAKPDVIFIHGCQFLDIKYFVDYKRKNPDTLIFVDNHSDFSNSATNWFSKNILHKFIWKHCAKMIEPYTEKFFGVLPARVEFLKDIYDINPKKIELLVMGADDEKVEKASTSVSILQTRKKYNILPDEFLIISGGKIDHAKKQTLELMKLVNETDLNIKLIVFGSVINELKNEVKKQLSEKVKYIGWLNVDQTYQLIGASDLAVFPGRHSVIWEQVIGMGKPAILKYWEGTTHVDLGGNVRFLMTDNKSELKKCLEEIVTDKNKYSEMLKVAESEGKENFAYTTIAKKSIKI